MNHYAILKFYFKFTFWYFKQYILYYNPKYDFIENPQTGKMRYYINGKPYYDVDYCKYSDWGCTKRMRVWPNVIGFTPKLCKRDCGYIVGKSP